MAIHTSLVWTPTGWKGKPLRVVHRVVIAAEYQSVRKFDPVKSDFEWFGVQETRGRKDQLEHYSFCSSKW